MTKTKRFLRPDELFRLASWLKENWSRLQHMGRPAVADEAATVIGAAVTISNVANAEVAAGLKSRRGGTRTNLDARLAALELRVSALERELGVKA